MERTDILMAQACSTAIELTNSCKNELGIWDDEKFKITDIIGDFDQVRVINQSGDSHIINPNQIKSNH